MRSCRYNPSEMVKSEFIEEGSAMRTVQEIEKAVSRLPLEELARFREWFDEFDAKVWDKQFEADAKSGKLDRILRS